MGLEQLFWRLRHENEDAAVQAGIDLRAITTKAHVASNPVLLGGILQNLLTNAIKYTEPGGRILIGCRRSGSEIRIDIYDTGIGIPEQQTSEFSICSHGLRPNTAMALASGSPSSVVRLKCLATGLQSDRSWGKDPNSLDLRTRCVGRYTLKRRHNWTFSDDRKPVPRPIHRCDPRTVLICAKNPVKIRSIASGMRQVSNEKPLVHVVDDDASMRGALEGVFRNWSDFRPRHMPRRRTSFRQSLWTAPAALFLMSDCRI